jgi:hypothetical protein
MKRLRTGGVNSKKSANSMVTTPGVASKSLFREKLLSHKKPGSSPVQKAASSPPPAFLESPQIVVCVLEGRNLLVVDEER